MQSLTPTRENTAVFTSTIYSSVYYWFKTDKVHMNLSWNETVKESRRLQK